MRGLLLIIVGAILGGTVYHLFFAVDVKESIHSVEKTHTDTVWVPHKQTIDFAIRHKTLNDSIEYFKELYKKELGNVKIVHDSVFTDKPFTAPLRRYNGLENTLYGDVSYNAVVAGSLLDMKISTDFRMPNITNTVEKTTTRTVVYQPKGLYLTGGINSNFNYKVGAVYLKDRSLFQYQYTPQLDLHEIGVGFKPFK